jgi:uncharacterized membrane protein YgdD (TMEM256/DUF423 family)
MRWITIGAVSAGLAVAAGAFGAHALKSRLGPDLLAVFETGARYQMYHALGLILIGVLGTMRPSSLLDLAGGAMVAGTLLFSGSLYALALTGIRAFGAITPIGGVAFLAGWAMLAWSARR